MDSRTETKASDEEENEDEPTIKVISRTDNSLETGEMDTSVQMCVVPGCHSNSELHPEKLFVPFPKKFSQRQAWADITGISADNPSLKVFACEDHFDMYTDTVNFIKHKLMGCTLKMKFGVVPHINVGAIGEVTAGRNRTRMQRESRGTGRGSHSTEDGRSDSGPDATANDRDEFLCCAVTSCKNDTVRTRANPSIRYHPFPALEDFRYTWVELCRLKVPVTEKSRVCSEHFALSCFEQIDEVDVVLGAKSKLAIDAVPTLRLKKQMTDKEKLKMKMGMNNTKSRKKITKQTCSSKVKKKYEYQFVPKSYVVLERLEIDSGVKTVIINDETLKKLLPSTAITQKSSPVIATDSVSLGPRKHSVPSGQLRIRSDLMMSGEPFTNSLLIHEKQRLQQNLVPLSPNLGTPPLPSPQIYYGPRFPMLPRELTSISPLQTQSMQNPYQTQIPSQRQIRFVPRQMLQTQRPDYSQLPAFRNIQRCPPPPYSMYQQELPQIPHQSVGPTVRTQVAQTLMSKRSQSFASRFLFRAPTRSPVSPQDVQGQWNPWMAPISGNQAHATTPPGYNHIRGTSPLAYKQSNPQVPYNAANSPATYNSKSQVTHAPVNSPTYNPPSSQMNFTPGNSSVTNNYVNRTSAHTAVTSEVSYNPINALVSQVANNSSNRGNLVNTQISYNHVNLPSLTNTCINRTSAHTAVTSEVSYNSMNALTSQLANNSSNPGNLVNTQMSFNPVGLPSVNLSYHPVNPLTQTLTYDPVNSPTSQIYNSINTPNSQMTYNSVNSPNSQLIYNPVNSPNTQVPYNSVSSPTTQVSYNSMNSSLPEVSYDPINSPTSQVAYNAVNVSTYNPVNPSTSQLRRRLSSSQTVCAPVTRQFQCAPVTTQETIVPVSSSIPNPQDGSQISSGNVNMGKQTKTVRSVRKDGPPQGSSVYSAGATDWNSGGQQLTLEDCVPSCTVASSNMDMQQRISAARLDSDKDNGSTDILSMHWTKLQKIHSNNLELLCCRICLSTLDLIDIFQKDGDLKIANKLWYITAIMVSKDDGLPTKVCRTCQQTIHMAYCFKRICEMTNDKLRSIQTFRTYTKQGVETPRKPAEDRIAGINKSSESLATTERSVIKNVENIVTGNEKITGNPKNVSSAQFVKTNVITKHCESLITELLKHCENNSSDCGNVVNTESASNNLDNIEQLNNTCKNIVTVKSVSNDSRTINTMERSEKSDANTKTRIYVTPTEGVEKNQVVPKNAENILATEKIRNNIKLLENCKTVNSNNIINTEYSAKNSESATVFESGETIEEIECLEEISATMEEYENELFIDNTMNSPEMQIELMSDNAQITESLLEEDATAIKEELVLNESFIEDCDANVIEANLDEGVANGEAENVGLKLLLTDNPAGPTKNEDITLKALLNSSPKHIAEEKPIGLENIVTVSVRGGVNCTSDEIIDTDNYNQLMILEEIQIISDSSDETNTDSDTDCENKICRGIKRKRSAKPNPLQDHFESETDCDPDPKRSPSSHQITSEPIQHNQYNPELPHSCVHCNADFKDNTAWLEHHKVNKVAEPFPCGLCCQWFTMRCARDTHVADHTRLDVTPYLCEQCPEMFRLKGMLLSHLRTHGIYQCFNCPGNFSDYTQFLSHVNKAGEQKDSLVVSDACA